MNVIICDNNSSNLSSAKSAIEGKVETFEMDVSKVEDFERLKGMVEKDLDGISTVHFYVLVRLLDWYQRAFVIFFFPHVLKIHHPPQLYHPKTNV